MFNLAIEQVDEGVERVVNVLHARLYLGAY